MNRNIIVLAATAALALFASVLLLIAARPDTIIFVRMDIRMLIIISNLALAAGLITLATVHHVQERVAQQRLIGVQTQAAIDRRHFLSRLDHELKNPLMAIRAGLANLDGVPDDTQVVVGSITTQTLRLSRLAADLRKLAKIETQPLEVTQVALPELLQEVITLIETRPEARERRLRLVVPQAPWPLPSVAADQDLLFIALHNVLDNAIKFSQPGAMIELRAFEHANQIAIEIADTGPGIPDDEIAFVWNDLYRGEHGRTVAGSGLGLPLVRAIVQRHHGQATLRTRLGQGTVVIIRLPIAGVTVL